MTAPRKLLVPIRPLDAIQVPDHVDGRQGKYRANPDMLQIPAQTDVDAVRCFLREYDRSPGTLRLYKRETERLVLWALVECEKPLSSLDRQDYEGYLNFLVDPQPSDIWCGRRAPQTSDDWRPFVGPLKDAAVLTALAAVNSLLSYLTDAGYLIGNPLGLVRQRQRKMAIESPQTSKKSTAPAVLAATDEMQKVERFLDAEMWDAVTRAIDSMPRTNDQQCAEYERARFLAATLYMLAPRAGELETHRMNSFREERGRWWWHVVGKGGTSAKVPVADDMLHALVRYRKSLGLPAVPKRSDKTPLLVSLKDGSPITARRLNQILKRIFSRAADFLPPESDYKKEKLLAASAHWGRHTGITAKLDSGIAPRYVQKDARHRDARTTQRYIHEEEDTWHDEAQKQRLPWDRESTK